MAGSALLAIAALPWQKLELAIASSKALPAVPARAVAGLAATLARAAALQRPTVLAFGFVIGLAAWGAEGLGLYCIASIFEPHVSCPLPLGSMRSRCSLALSLSSPAAWGSTEAVMTTLLTSQRFALADALLITLLCRLATLWLAIFLGWVAMAALRHRSSVALTFG